MYSNNCTFFHTTHPVIYPFLIPINIVQGRQRTTHPPTHRPPSNPHVPIRRPHNPMQNVCPNKYKK